MDTTLLSPFLILNAMKENGAEKALADIHDTSHSFVVVLHFSFLLKKKVSRASANPIFLNFAKRGF